MNVLDKIIAGGPGRRTRFHDEKGNRLDLKGMSYAPRTFFEAVLRVSLGVRPERPWISYRAVDHIKTLIKPQWRMAEFGSGMSTIWFARQVSFLLSVESDPSWYEIVSQRVHQLQLSNVRYELRPLRRYDDLSEFPDRYFDFVLVDGETRATCVQNAVPKIRPGGWLYLDNSDKATVRLAEAELRRAVKQRSGTHRYFTDLVPCQLTTCQGLLANL